MSAVKAVFYLLSQNAGLIAVCPAAKISAGPVPQGTAAPAISIDLVSTVREQNVVGATGICRTRVQVTYIASTYPLLRAGLDLVRAALPRSRGTHNGVKVDQIRMGTEGPDFNDPAAELCFGSQDVLVTWLES